MAVNRRIVVCAVLSVGAHVAFARAMRRLPPRAAPPSARIVSIRVVASPPPEPPPEPALPPPEQTPKPAERARLRRAVLVAEPTTPKDVPPPEHPPAPSATPGTPVFGVSMESTSPAGGGPSMPIGSPGGPRAGHAGGAAEGDDKAAASAPVPAYELSTMPLPQGRCFGKYTEEAKLAAVEGTVVLDLVVGADGRVTNIHVVSGLPHGLTDAAIAAAKECRFSPGRKGDTAVPVRVREFKIRFLLDNAE